MYQLATCLIGLRYDIYITGSNAKLLSGELATYLGGRYVEFVIYPFPFAEFMELYRPIAPDEPIQKCFQQYLLSGGMPYLANIRYADAPSKQYLHDLFNSVQLKDIVKRNKIRDVDLLERIIAYGAAQDHSYAYRDEQGHGSYAVPAAFRNRALFMAGVGSRSAPYLLRCDLRSDTGRLFYPRRKRNRVTSSNGMREEPPWLSGFLC